MRHSIKAVHDSIQAVTNGTTFAAPKKRRNDDEEELEVMTRMMQEKKPYATYEAILTQHQITFMLNQAISDPELYTDMIFRIRNAQPHDIIYIHLNTPGGRLDTGIQLINAMKSSQARIVAVLDSKAFSLGTLIFLAADEFVVHNNCQFMIHNFSSMTHGKGNEQQSELLATIAWFKDIGAQYYIPFLNKEELNNVLSGQDLWMGSEEVRRRLKRMVAIQNGEKVDDEVAAKPTKKPRTPKPKAAKDVAAVVVEIPAESKPVKTEKAAKASMGSFTVKAIKG